MSLGSRRKLSIINKSMKTCASSICIHIKVLHFHANARRENIDRVIHKTNLLDLFPIIKKNKIRKVLLEILKARHVLSVNKIHAK